MRLKNKVALNTGGSSGIGRVIATVFAREGARVVVADTDNTGGEETAQMIRDSRGEAIFVHADVSKLADAERMVKTTAEKHGKLDVRTCK